MASHERRQFVYIPEISPESFLLFFEKRADSTAWSVRDYSVPGQVSTRYGQEFGWLSSEALSKAQYAFPAPVVSASELDFWRRETQAKNKEYLHFLNPSLAAQSPRHFPVLQLEALLALPKARQVLDMKRLLESPRSEDWVTWNFFQLFRRAEPAAWLARLAQQGSVDLEGATLEFWRKTVVAQSFPSAPPANGSVEIDVVLQSPRTLVFITTKAVTEKNEASHPDQLRQQFLRSIDALLEAAGAREARFWTLLRDVEANHFCANLSAEYKANPDRLQQELPHRDPAQVARVASTLASLRWADLARPWLHQSTDEELAERVRQELLRRIDPRRHPKAA